MYSKAPCRIQVLWLSTGTLNEYALTCYESSQQSQGDPNQRRIHGFLHSRCQIENASSDSQVHCHRFAAEVNGYWSNGWEPVSRI